MGKTLTASIYGWTTGTTFSYQWRRGDVLIANAKSTTYTLVAADLGHTMSVAVIGSKPGYVSVTRISAATARVLDAFTATPTPTISGTAAVGHKLTASIGGTWAPEATLSIQWKSNGTYVGDGSNTYVLTKADGGAAITVTVTATRPGYATTSQTSAPTTHVTGGILVMPNFSVYGYSYQVGGYVTFRKSGSWPAGSSHTFQWNASGVPIPGETQPVLILKPDLAGKTISVTVLLTKPYVPDVSKTSAPTPVIQP